MTAVSKFNSIAIVASVLLLSVVSFAAGPSAYDIVVMSATQAFRSAVDGPNAAIPAAVMRKARAIAIVPDALNSDRMTIGTGILSTRAAGSTIWSPPAVFEYSGRIAPTLKDETVDLYLIAVTPNGVGYLTGDTEDGIYSEVIPPGPLGGDTRVRMDVDVLAYMRFGKFFAGVTISDWAICPLSLANEALYGKKLAPKDILVNRAHLSPAVEAWRDALSGYFKELR